MNIFQWKWASMNMMNDIVTYIIFDKCDLKTQVNIKKCCRRYNEIFKIKNIPHISVLEFSNNIAKYWQYSISKKDEYNILQKIKQNGLIVFTSKLICPHLNLRTIEKEMFEWSFNGNGNYIEWGKTFNAFTFSISEEDCLCKDEQIDFPGTDSVIVVNIYTYDKKLDEYIDITNNFEDEMLTFSCDITMDIRYELNRIHTNLNISNLIGEDILCWFDPGFLKYLDQCGIKILSNVFLQKKID